MSTKISWCDEVWNPVAGCSKCSPGCANCYAERMALRLACIEYSKFGEKAGEYKYTSVTDLVGKWNGKVFCDEKALNIPLHWRNPRRIFVCSMSDLFHPKVPFEFICRVLDVARACKNHTFLFLTKRSHRLLEFYQWHHKLQPQINWKTFNNWQFGVSISTSDEIWKVAELLKIPTAVRFVSHEPLLSYTNMQGQMTDWAIIGAESGPKRRPCKMKWVYDLIDQYKYDRVPIFIKQLSINGKVERNINKFPKDLRLQEWPNTAQNGKKTTQKKLKSTIGDI